MKPLTYLRQKPTKYLFDGCKLHYHQDRLKQFLDGERIAPLHIDMGIHKQCNIRCVYCYGIKQKLANDYIPTDRLLQLAYDAYMEGIKSLAIIGDGEPTLNEGLYKFVETLHNYKVDCAVATNGLLLNTIDTKTLTRNCKWIRFNVSGTGDRYSDIHRGADKYGGWDKFDSVVQEAVKYTIKCTIGLQAVLIPQGFDEILPLARYAVKRGVDYLVIKQFSDPGSSIPSRFDLDLYAKATTDLITAQAMSTHKTKIIIKWSAMEDSRNITKSHKWDFDACIDLPLIFQISGNGDCFPCGYLFGNPDYRYGSVIKQDLSDIIASDRYWDIIAKVATTPLAKLCQGQCRHCETLKFVDRIKKATGNSVEEKIIDMCGSRTQYDLLMNNPPEHRNFI